MSSSVCITVPVRYETDGKKYDLFAVKDSCIIGRDEDGELAAFDWATGRREDLLFTQQDMEEAGRNKVRRNFWARRLVDLWNGRTTVEAVKGGFAADDLTGAFEADDSVLRLLPSYPALCDLLKEILED